MNSVREQCGVDETRSVSFAHESYALVNAVSPPYSLVLPIIIGSPALGEEGDLAPKTVNHRHTTWPERTADPGSSTVRSKTDSS